eukprot:7171344-Prymnesium_polylepis.1
MVNQSGCNLVGDIGATPVSMQSPEPCTEGAPAWGALAELGKDSITACLKGKRILAPFGKGLRALARQIEAMGESTEAVHQLIGETIVGA